MVLSKELLQKMITACDEAIEMNGSKYAQNRISWIRIHLNAELTLEI